MKPRGITGKIRIMCKHTTVAIPPVEFEMEQDCAWMDSELTIRNSSLIGEILREVFLSDQPLATGYRQFLAEQNRRAPWELAGLVGKNGVTNR